VKVQQRCADNYNKGKGNDKRLEQRCRYVGGVSVGRSVQMKCSRQLVGRCTISNLYHTNWELDVYVLD
jgi:hypothetical protein